MTFTVTDQVRFAIENNIKQLYNSLSPNDYFKFYIIINDIKNISKTIMVRLLATIV